MEWNLGRGSICIYYIYILLFLSYFVSNGPCTDLDEETHIEHGTGRFFAKLGSSPVLLKAKSMVFGVYHGRPLFLYDNPGVATSLFVG